MSSETNQFGVDRQALQIYASGFNDSELLTMFGMKIEFPQLDVVQAVVDEARPGHMGGMGKKQAINGGVLAALYDLVVGCSAALVDPARRSATVQLSMNFERPVIGDYVCASARVDRAGKSLVFSSAEIVDREGRVCSHGQGVVRLSRHPWRGDSPGQ